MCLVIARIKVTVSAFESTSALLVTFFVAMTSHQVRCPTLAEYSLTGVCRDRRVTVDALESTSALLVTLLSLHSHVTMYTSLAYFMKNSKGILLLSIVKS
jgi:hypothetical protein